MDSQEWAKLSRNSAWSFLLYGIDALPVAVAVRPGVSGDLRAIAGSGFRPPGPARVSVRDEPMGAVGALGRASGLPTAPDSPFFLGHGNAAGVQCGFSRAVRGPGQRGQRSSGKSRVILHPERPAEEAPPMLVIVLASASIGLALADEPPPGPTAEAIRAGVTRALPLLEKGSAGYVAQRDCFSCHHQAVPSFALDLARRRGFEVDADNLADTDRTDALRSLLRTRLLQEGRGSGWGGDPGRLCPLDARPRRPRGGRGDRGRRGLHPGPRAGAGALADFVEPATLGVEPVHDHVRRRSGASRASPSRPRRSGSTSGPRRSAPGWRRPSRTTTRSGSSGSGD